MTYLKNVTRSSSLRTMAIWTNLLALLGCSAPQNQVVRGPLAVNYSLERDYRLNLFVNNANGKLIGTHTTSYYTISYQGKPVAVTNREGKKAAIWQTQFLTDAPRTALLASSNNVYLITDDNGQARVSIISEKSGDLSVFRWLDSDQGQPGRQQLSLPRDNSGAAQSLTGGRYLLVDDRSVLDVHTLTNYPFDVISQAAIQRMDGFIPRETGLVGFSPGKTRVVWLGTRYNQQGNRAEYALLAIDFAKNQVYAVPFRPSATQFIWAEDATPDWLATYFDWTTDEQGKELLRVHHYTQHPPWHGRWAQSLGEGEQPIRYEVKPVLPIMYDHFMTWLKKQYPAIEPTVDRYEGMISAKFTINGSVFNLYVRNDYRSLGLESTDQTRLKTIGDGFDAELRKGRFQDGFGAMDPD